MSELSTPYETLHAFTNEQGIKCVSVVDCNGFHVFDCYEADASELLSRINRYEQLKARVVTVEKAFMQILEEVAREHGFTAQEWLADTRSDNRPEYIDLFNQSPQQSLASIQADAVEKMVSGAYLVDYTFIDKIAGPSIDIGAMLSYAKEVRNDAG